MGSRTPLLQDLEVLFLLRGPHGGPCAAPWNQVWANVGMLQAGIALLMVTCIQRVFFSEYGPQSP